MIASGNVGVAFALTIGAGLSTALGASIVFFPRLVTYANRTTLASALGFSAGVMTYVSFIEIFRKSVDSFVEAGYSDVRAYKLATLCFFGGVFVMLLLNAMVTWLLNGHHHHHDHHDTHQQTDDHGDNTKKEIKIQNEFVAEDDDVSKLSEKEKTDATAEKKSLADFSPCLTCSEDPVQDLQRIQTMAATIEIEQQQQQQQQQHHDANNNLDPSEFFDFEVDANGVSSTDQIQANTPETTTDTEGKLSDTEKKRLTLLSFNTAIAIGLHNFPEGLATFVAVLNDPKVGFVLAIAIAIHNIPEGICVALPVYYASGSRRKAFLLALLSGVSEPIAALFGYLILASTVSHSTYAVLFGIVAGMMIIICTRELLPTAHRYDPEDSYVTTSYIIGMAVMALTLVLFVS